MRMNSAGFWPARSLSLLSGVNKNYDLDHVESYLSRHMPRSQDDIVNLLLCSLPPATLQALRPALESIEIPRGRIIDRADAPVTHLYFVNRGLICLVKTMQDGRTVEIGAVGIEGVTDPNSLFGVIDNAITEAVVQVPGQAFRVRRDVLRDLMQTDRALWVAMRRYMRFFVNQIVQTAACNRLHSLDERCCRWLLVAHDNARSDSFPLTHEFLAMMLGVQRAGVSLAAKQLQQANFIQYKRGIVTITDRTGLEHASCECYGAIKTQLNQLFVLETSRSRSSASSDTSLDL